MDLNLIALSALERSYSWLDTNNQPCEILAHTDEWVLLRRQNGDEEAWPLKKSHNRHFLYHFHLPILELS